VPHRSRTLREPIRGTTLARFTEYSVDEDGADAWAARRRGDGWHTGSVERSPEAYFIDACEELRICAAAQSVLLVASELFVEVRAPDARAPGPAALTPLLAGPVVEEAIDLGGELALYAIRLHPFDATVAVVVDTSSTSLAVVRLCMRLALVSLRRLFADLGRRPTTPLPPSNSGSGPVGGSAPAWLSVAIRRRPPD
jgi:hypothetical protein